MSLKKIKTILKINIEWELSLDEVTGEIAIWERDDLPQYIEYTLRSDMTPEELDQEAILESLCDRYGYLISEANFELVYETE